jgi:hypothetical protein
MIMAACTVFIMLMLALVAALEIVRAETGPALPGVSIDEPQGNVIRWCFAEGTIIELCW